MRQSAAYRELQSTMHTMTGSASLSKDCGQTTKMEADSIADGGCDGTGDAESVNTDAQPQEVTLDIKEFGLKEDEEEENEGEPLPSTLDLAPSDQKAFKFDPKSNQQLAGRTCMVCMKPFAARSRLLCHLMYTKCGKDHSKLPPDDACELAAGLTIDNLACPLCNKTFKKVRDARIHYALKSCTKSPSEEKLLSKVGKFFKCRFCDYQALKSYSVFSHENREHEDQAPHVHQCDECERSYSSKTGLTRHIGTVHRNQDWVICDHCGKNVRRRYLNEHLRVVHRIQVSDVPPPVIYKEPVKCAHCDYTTTKHVLLCEHTKRVHGPRIHKCTQCSSAFARNSDLNVHVKMIHGKQTGLRADVKCPHCPKVMKRRNLAIHIRSVHEKKKMAYCGICQRAYSSNWSLKAHMELHKKPDERRYRFHCYCGLQFNNRTSFVDHQNTHTFLRPYHCGVCYKTFRHRSVLRRHLDVHAADKSFACKVCNKTFPTSHKLQLHKYIKKHGPSTLETPSKQECPCGEAFFQQKQLRSHQELCPVWLNLGQNPEKAATVKEDSGSEATIAADGGVLPVLSLVEDGGDEKSLVFYQEQNKDGTTLYFIQPEGENTPVSEEDIQKALMLVQDGDVSQTDVSVADLTPQATMPSTDSTTTIQAQVSTNPQWGCSLSFVYIGCAFVGGWGRPKTTKGLR